MRKLVIVLLAVAVIAGLLVFFKNVIARSAIEAGFKQVTGAPMQIGKFRFSFFKNTVEAGNMKIFNPPAFSDRLMADIPLFYLDFNLAEYFKSRIHIRDLKLQIASIEVVRNRKAEINIESLKALQPKGGGKAPELAIDLVEFSVGKIVYKDYTLGSPLVKEFNLNINEKYNNITDLNMLVNAIIARALRETPLSGLAGLNMDKLNSDLEKALSTRGDKVRKNIENEMNNALNKFKGQLGDIGNISK